MGKLRLEQELDALFGKKNQRIKPGIESVQEALTTLAQDSYFAPSVLIGGTNGKGTTSGMLWQLLASAGVKVGLFTSPHILNFSERIQTSHVKIDDNYLLAAAKELQASLSAELYERLSFFDLTTLLAHHIFHTLNCEWNIYEVGMGGRWDSTNALKHEMMAIVSIGFDHEQWLGNTLSQITQEKLGIVRADKPLYWGLDDQIDGEATLALQIKHRETAFPLIKVKEYIKLIEGDKISMSLPHHPPVVMVLPEWVKQASQIVQSNFCISTVMFYNIVHHQRFASVRQRLGVEPRDVFQLGFKNFDRADITWPPTLRGRFQRVQYTNPFIIDVCHNVDSIQQFILSMKKQKPNGKVPGIVSILKDKNVSQMLELLKEVLDPIILFQSGGERALTQEKLLSEQIDLPLFANFSSAWLFAKNNWQINPQTEIAVCGSFYAVSNFFQYFEH